MNAKELLNACYIRQLVDTCHINHQLLSFITQDMCNIVVQYMKLVGRRSKQI